MRIGDIVAAGALGASKGFLSNQAVQNERARKKSEDQRRQELLLEREKLKASIDAKKEQSRRSFELEKAEKQHGYRMEELGAKGKNYDPIKDQTSLRKSYQKYVSDSKTQGLLTGEDIKPFESWASENYPEMYSKAFGGAVDIDNKISTGGQIPRKEGSIPKNSKFAALFARVKQGANSDVKQQPETVIERKGVVYDTLPRRDVVLEPMPLAVPGEETKREIPEAQHKKIKKDVKNLAEKTGDKQLKTIAKEIGYSKDKDIVAKLYTKLQKRLKELREKK